MFEVSVCLFFNVGGRSASIFVFSPPLYNYLVFLSANFVSLDFYMSCYSSFSNIHVSVVLKVTFNIGLHAVGGRTCGRSRDYQFSRVCSGPFFLTHGAPLRARESSAYNNYWRDQSQVKMLLLHLCSLPSFHMKKVQTCMIGLRSLHDIHS